jgi:predicted nucleic acid-binding protein
MGANNKVFVDTWAWLAIANGNDNYHEAAKKCLDDIYSNNKKMVTSDYVLDEVITSLFSKTSHENGVRFVDAILQSVEKEH